MYIFIMIGTNMWEINIQRVNRLFIGYNTNNSGFLNKSIALTYPIKAIFLEYFNKRIKLNHLNKVNQNNDNSGSEIMFPVLPMIISEYTFMFSLLFNNSLNTILPLSIKDMYQ